MEWLPLEYFVENYLVSYNDKFQDSLKIVLDLIERL